MLANQSKEVSPEAPPPSTDQQPEAVTEGGTDELIIQSEPSEQNEETPDREEEGSEEGSDVQNSASNRFLGLSEEGAENLEVEEEDGHEEAELAKSVRALSISKESQSEEMESGAESELELGAEPELVVVNADPKTAFSTLSSRTPLNTTESSVESCLLQFTQVEQLTNSNSLLCVTCSRRATHGIHTHTRTCKVNSNQDR